MPRPELADVDRSSRQMTSLYAEHPWPARLGGIKPWNLDRAQAPPADTQAAAPLCRISLARAT